MKKRELNDFSDLLDLLFATSKVVVSDIWLVLDSHHCDSWVNLGRKWELDLNLGPWNARSLATDSHSLLNVCRCKLLVKSDDILSDMLQVNNVLSIFLPRIDYLGATTDLECRILFKEHLILS